MVKPVCEFQKEADRETEKTKRAKKKMEVKGKNDNCCEHWKTFVFSNTFRSTK